MSYVRSTQDLLRVIADETRDGRLAELVHALADQMDELEFRGKTFTGRYERLVEEANDILTEYSAEE